jgi:Flp pilus assembly protein TadB
MKRNDDVVAASELAAYAWCPESWRLDTLGAEPENRAALQRGERRHARTALFERLSAVAIRVGVWLLVLGLLLAALAFVLVCLLGGCLVRVLNCVVHVSL